MNNDGIFAGVRAAGPFGSAGAFYSGEGHSAYSVLS